MFSQSGKRAQRGAITAAVLGAVAILALSGLALAHGGHGHHRHGPDTGTIASFDSATGVLAIQLTGGDTVSGLVTRRTKIKCEDEHPPLSKQGRKGEPGDDHGRGHEHGDDHGGGNDSGWGSGPSGHDDNGTGANCTVADLLVGAPVHEAELDLKNGKALFHEVELSQ